MKRNFITGIAMMVAAFFVGTEIAQAADVSFSGSVRTRYENENRGAFTVGGANNDLVATQVRLNTKANINADTSAFIQMQSNRTWGTANSNAYTASDNDTTVGIHQAYFTLKNVYGSGIGAKVGRQEVVLDGHRLFGHTGWTTGAQTHDAVRLSHSHDNMTMTYVLSASVEGANSGHADLDVQTHLLHNNFQGVLGGNLSTYVIYTDDSCGINSNACTGGGFDNQWYTLGGRQVGKMFGLDYRAEAYWQLGKAGGASAQISAASISSYNTVATTIRGFETEGNKRDAYMFGVRVGKKFSNVTWSPKVTLWFDYLSGNNDENMNKGEWSAFDTHFDTGHKFYGFMDLFLNNTGANTNWMGLQDAAVKVVMKPAAGWTLKADYHNFRTTETIGGNPGLATRTGILSAAASSLFDTRTLGAAQTRNLGNHLGDELDFTLVHAYNPNTKLSFGYSLFMA